MYRHNIREIAIVDPTIAGCLWGGDPGRSRSNRLLGRVPNRAEMAPKLLIIVIMARWRPLSHKPLGPNVERGFTLAEVMIASAVCVLFGLAAFTTNERLLVALKTQKETTAANMMLQERMETFRSFSY